MDAKSALVFARHRMHGEIHDDHALALFELVKPYNKLDTTILEIGTKHGFSAAIMAMACPLAKIITLNPSLIECAIAKQNLASFPKIEIKQVKSWDYLPGCIHQFDVVFVDGDHNRIAKDMPWWAKIKTGGLMLFHDYDKEHSIFVYNQLNDFAKQIGRDFDFLMTVNGNGLVGIYKK